MDNYTFQRLGDTLSKANNIAIAVGQNPQVDDMAGALALFLTLKQAGKNVSIASASQPLVEHSDLVGIDKVKSQFGGGNGDLIVSFPYKEGEIEKVSYTIDQGYLNIVVKAGRDGLNFKEQDVRFSQGGTAPELLFIVGTPRLSDLGAIFNPEALKNTTIVNVDNKRDNQGFGDLVFVSQNASSVSEVVASMLLSMNMEFDVDAAQNLLNGITKATNDFQSPETSPVAFEMVGRLMQKGARRGGMNSQSRAPQQQNEERVSSFMPEKSLSGSGTGVNNPQAQPQLQRQQRMQQPESQNNQNQNSAQTRQKPPADWLTPKVYKGSSNVQ